MTASDNLYFDKGLTNWLKIIAAFAVIFHHYSQYALSELGQDNFILRCFSLFGGYCGVAIFFFLSGYGLMESDLNKQLSAIQFFKRRFLKLYIPVFLATAIWLYLCPLFTDIDLSRFGATEIGGGHFIKYQQLTI